MRTRAIKANLLAKVRFFYILIIFLTPAVFANEFEQIQYWQQNGAYELALSELLQKQPAAASNYVVWERWERERYALYQALGRWKGVLERQHSLPSNATAAFRLWAEVQAAHALLELGDITAAFEQVQKKLWSDIKPTDMQVWRAVLVQIYAAQQDDEAVVTAWRRYRQDALQSQAQGNGTETELSKDEYSAALRAYARTLIRQEQYQEAVRELTDDSSVDGRLLLASGQLLVSGQTAEQVYLLARQIASSDHPTSDQKRRAYVVMARAAGRKKDYRARVNALVRALAIPPGASADNLLLTISADELWAAYEAWGLYLGTRLGLDSNYENQWSAALQQTRPADEKVALASVLVLNGRSAQSRERAAQALVEALPLLDHGADQALWLLNESERLQQNYVNMPDSLQRAALRAALRVADLDSIRVLRELRGPVTDPIADQANGILDVHARLLLGESAPANRFLSEGLDNLSAWFKSSQQDLLVLLRDLEAGGYHSSVALAGQKLASISSDSHMRIQAAEHACRAMIQLGQHRAAAIVALDQMAQAPDSGANDLALLAYEALWQAGMKTDAQQLWHRRLTAAEYQSDAADLRRRLQVPNSRR